MLLPNVETTHIRSMPYCMTLPTAAATAAAAAAPASAARSLKQSHERESRANKSHEQCMRTPLRYDSYD